METFPPLDSAHLLTQDRALRSISILYQKLWLFDWRVVSLPRERKLSRRWWNVDRQCTHNVDQQWSQKTSQAFFVTNLGPEVTTYYQYTPGWPETLFYCFLSHCWQLCFILFYREREREREREIRIGEREICTPWERECKIRSWIPQSNQTAAYLSILSRLIPLLLISSVIFFL